MTIEPRLTNELKWKATGRKKQVTLKRNLELIVGSEQIITKGQLISKYLFGIFNSPKKRTKNSTLILW